jgi:hypothetical protein
MLLGLHTYSFHLHGMGQNWGGHQLAWERVWDIFGLMDEAKKLGLEGLHLTAVDLGATDSAHLKDVRRAAEERGLYLEYNFSLDASAYDPRLTNTLEEGSPSPRRSDRSSARCPWTCIARTRFAVLPSTPR